MSAWDPNLYDTKHAFVAAYGEAVLDWLKPVAGERILDVGCGTGSLTKTIAQSGATVVGIDSSPEMVERAQEACPGIEIGLADASQFDFAEPFDAVFSNATLHWIRNAQGAANCMARALRPGGRFVAEFGGKGNIRTIESTTLAVVEDITGKKNDHGWFFPSIAEYTAILEQAGIEPRQVALFDRPTPLEGEDGLRNWLIMFGGAILAGLTPDQVEAVLAEVETRARPTMYVDGTWVADYVRLRVSGVRVP